VDDFVADAENHALGELGRVLGFSKERALELMRATLG
jgi:hypothetical protein